MTAARVNTKSRETTKKKKQEGVEGVMYIAWMDNQADVQAGDVRARWGRNRFGYRANVFMLWLGRRLLWLGYVAVAIGALWFFFTGGKARCASVKFWQRVTAIDGRGHRPGWLRLRWLAYRHMFSFGQLLLDRAVMLAGGGEGFAIECVGRPNLVEAGQSTDGVVMLTAHMGAAEIAAPFMKHMGASRKVNLVMFQDAADTTEKFHEKHRQALQDVAVISTADSLAAGVKIMAALRRNELVAMRADRLMEGKSVRVNFLGNPVLFPAGPFVTAVLSGAPVICVHALRVGYRKYRFMAGPVRRYESDREGRDALIARAAQDFADDLEARVRELPRQWGNFYDFWRVQRSSRT